LKLESSDQKGADPFEFRGSDPLKSRKTAVLGQSGEGGVV